MTQQPLAVGTGEGSQAQPGARAPRRWEFWDVIPSPNVSFNLGTSIFLYGLTCCQLRVRLPGSSTPHPWVCAGSVAPSWRTPPCPSPQLRMTGGRKAQSPLLIVGLPFAPLQRPLAGSLSLPLSLPSSPPPSALFSLDICSNIELLQERMNGAAAAAAERA